MFRLLRFASILVLSCIATTAHGEDAPEACDSTVTVNGAIIDVDSQEPVARLIAYLENSEGINIGAVTDENGRFQFENVSCGTYYFLTPSTLHLYHDGPVEVGVGVEWNYRLLDSLVIGGKCPRTAECAYVGTFDDPEIRLFAAIDESVDPVIEAFMTATAIELAIELAAEEAAELQEPVIVEFATVEGELRTVAPISLSAPQSVVDGRIEGTVVLEFSVDHHGVASQVSVRESLSPEADSACIEAVRQSRWRRVHSLEWPYQIVGVPYRCRFESVE